MKKNYLKNISFILCVTFLSVSLSGCHSLKKKFTRKKKKTSAPEFEPVLNPIDYPRAQASVTDKYDYHFSLRRVWHKNLLQAMEGDESEKRMKLYLDKEIVQLTEMQSLVVGEKKDILTKMIEDFRILRKEFDKPAQLRRLSSIERRLRALDNDVRNELDPVSMEGSLVNFL